MKKILLVLINAYLFISTAVIAVLDLGSDEITDSNLTGFTGSENFRFYTVDSNVLLALCAAAILFLIIMKKDTFRRWFEYVFLSAAVSVGVTFVTVALMLAPGQAFAGRGYFSLFTGDNLFFHFLNPAAGMIEFIFLFPDRGFSVKECLFAVIPTVIYAAVYWMNVALLKTWPDFYNFTFGGHMEMAPVAIILFPSLSFGMAVLLARLQKLRIRH